MAVAKEVPGRISVEGTRNDFFFKAMSSTLCTECRALAFERSARACFFRLQLCDDSCLFSFLESYYAMYPQFVITGRM